MPSTTSIDGDCARTRRSDAARPLIAIAAESRYLAQRQPAGLSAALTRAGYVPLFLDPDHGGSAPLEAIDLIVARGRSTTLLELLARAESLRVRTINRRTAIAAVLDKASMARALVAGGLPTPVSRAGSIAALAATFHSSDYPLIVKPVFGDNARGIRVVRSPAELSAMRWAEPVAIAQRLIPSDGFDLKLYVIGSEVHAVRKASPIAADQSAPPQPVPVTAALRALALRCGLLFGLELFGVDCIATPAGPVVIEVNDFPNYSGIDGADDCLARYLIERACAAFERRRS